MRPDVVSTQASHWWYTQRPFDATDAHWNELISHYRSRIERVIYRVKNHRWCQGVFRGSFNLLVQCLDITVITTVTALEIRQELELDRKPMFEVVGPWPHIFQ